MRKIREKLAGMMSGRYGERGVDELGRFLNVVTLVLIIISLLVRKLPIVYTICWWVAVVLLIWSYYRIFSRDFTKRARENDTYLKLRYNRAGFFAERRAAREDRKTHRIFTCPFCQQKVRVPKGKGRISIRCPKCGQEFIKKS